MDVHRVLLFPVLGFVLMLQIAAADCCYLAGILMARASYCHRGRPCCGWSFPDT